MIHERDIVDDHIRLVPRIFGSMLRDVSQDRDGRVTVREKTENRLIVTRIYAFGAFPRIVDHIQPGAPPEVLVDERPCLRSVSVHLKGGVELNVVPDVGFGAHVIEHRSFHPSGVHGIEHRSFRPSHVTVIVDRPPTEPREHDRFFLRFGDVGRQGFLEDHGAIAVHDDVSIRTLRHDVP